MKKVKVIVLLAIVCIFVFNLNLANADPVSFKTAQIVAENWMERVAGEKRKLVEEKRILYDNEHSVGYLFSFSNGGFVVVPADDIFESVKAWAKKGSFQSNINQTMSLKTLVLRDLRKQRKVVAKIKDRFIVPHKGWKLILKQTAINLTAAETDVIGPLLTSYWGQGNPYNTYCPIDLEGQRSVTGCVATAIAQILRYWQYPDYGIGNKCYYDYPGGWYGCGSDQEICADFTHFYDWDAMPNALDPNSSSETEIDAVARLMADAGVLAEMCYSSGGSYGNAQRLEEGLPIYLGYSSKIEFLNEYRTNFFAVAKTEIDKYWPMYFSSDGHAYVADGYRSDLEMDQVHFNFGWNGSSDGWYTLEKLDEFWNYPEEIWVNMIINIHPDGITDPPPQPPPTPPPGPNQPPVINSFDAAPNVGVAPLPVSFVCSASDADGYIVEYRWDFDGDGAVDQTTSFGDVNYTYQNAGSYQAAVTVADDDGAVTRAYVSITVKTAPPPPPPPPPDCFQAYPSEPLPAQRLTTGLQTDLQTIVVPRKLGANATIQPSLSISAKDRGRTVRLKILTLIRTPGLNLRGKYQFVGPDVVLDSVVVFDNFAEFPECGTDLSVYPSGTKIKILFGYNYTDKEGIRFFDKLNGFILLIE